MRCRPLALALSIALLPAAAQAEDLIQTYQLARGSDPQLAAFYRHLMVDRGHGHTEATVAVARKLNERT